MSETIVVAIPDSSLDLAGFAALLPPSLSVHLSPGLVTAGGEGAFVSIVAIDEA